jgi:hypothetical protein
MQQDAKTGTIINLNEEKEKMNSKLQILPGGKGPVDSNDWLSLLPEGTEFTAKEKNNPNSWIVPLFKVVKKNEKSIVLVTPSSNLPIYADPIVFSRNYRLYEDYGFEATDEEAKKAFDELSEELDTALEKDKD